jgi:hypothetical protein
MIFRIYLFLLLGLVLCRCSAQNKSFSEFRSYPQVNSETIFWSNEYTRPKLGSGVNANSIYFVDRFDSGTLDYRIVTLKLNSLDIETNRSNLKVDFADLEKFHSNVSFLKNDKMGVLIGYGIIYLFKTSTSRNNKDEKFTLVDSIYTDKYSGEETVYLNNTELIIIDKVQPKLTTNGGFRISCFNLKQKKLKRQKTFEGYSSMMFYYDENYSYGIVTEKYIYLYDVLEARFVKLNHKLKLINSINVPLETKKRNLEPLKLYLGSITLLDTVQSISKKMTRMLNAIPIGEDILLITQISESDTVRFEAHLLKENGDLVSTRFTQTELQIIAQSKSVASSGNLYSFTTFGNVNFMGDRIPEEEFVKILYAEKPKLGLYVFKLN